MLAANTITVSVYVRVFCTVNNNNCVRTHNARVSDCAKEQLNFSLKWLTAKKLFQCSIAVLTIDPFHSLVNVSGGLVVATGYGMLHRVSWDGRFDGSLQINLSLVPFTTDLLPETRGRWAIAGLN